MNKCLLATEEEKRKTLLTYRKVLNWKGLFFTATEVVSIIYGAGSWCQGYLTASVSDSNSVLIAEIAKDKGTVHLRDTKQHSTLKTISHTNFWWTIHNSSVTFSHCCLISEGTTPFVCIHVAFPAKNVSLIYELNGKSSPWNCKTPPLWVGKTQARAEINIIELRKWKTEDSHTWYDGFSI